MAQRTSTISASASWLASALSCSLFGAACGAGDLGSANDTGLDGLALAKVAPAEIVPGSRIVVTGTSFVDAKFGASVLHLAGALDGMAVDVKLPLRFVDYGRMEDDYTSATAVGLPADHGTFDGQATVEVRSSIDGEIHASAAVKLKLVFQKELTPKLTSLTGGPVIFVNEPIRVTGDGILLGGGEGQTFAEVAGCYLETGAPTCKSVGPVLVPVTPAVAYDRAHGTFPFDPAIAGIKPGLFRGTVKLRNIRADKSTSSSPAQAEYTLDVPAVFTVSPAVASLGQFVDINGGGFIAPERPGEPVSTTSIELAGNFTPEGTTTPVAVRLSVIPEFESGPLVRYVLNEDDALGTRLDLRTSAGKFEGTARPVISRGADTVRGDATPVVFNIAHVKQVVWIVFTPGYVESLRKFGLRAVDSDIRARVLEVARRDYAGVNIEFRTAQPTDYSLYATVEIGGPDLNGLGYFGYDNTPGKDIGNQRLYDKIGGLNATTQQDDGQPGYGGVFVESMFAFSMHPNKLAMMVDGASPLFDQTFDPFRPDLSGAPVLAADVAAGFTRRSTGQGCPAPSGSRAEKISCAVFVVGSMIGTTMTHEIGHSLGLAAPDGDPQQYHDLGDKPNRLMDGGAGRTLAERAELAGEGPSVFCDEEYAYLRQILPSKDPAPSVMRPGCK